MIIAFQFCLQFQPRPYNMTNNFHKHFPLLAHRISEAFLFPDTFDMEAIDSKLLSGTYEGKLGSVKVKRGTKYTAEQIAALKVGWILNSCHVIQHCLDPSSLELINLKSSHISHPIEVIPPKPSH